MGKGKKLLKATFSVKNEKVEIALYEDRGVYTIYENGQRMFSGFDEIDARTRFLDMSGDLVRSAD